MSFLEAIKLVGTVGFANQLTGSRLVEHIPDGQYKVSIILSSIALLRAISLALTGS
jgi:hypothetical protein